MDLKGKTIVVTGASRGIGRAIAIALSKYGANIVAVYHQHHEEAVSLAFEITENLLLIRADITNEDNIKEIFSQVNENFSKVDILINNAGINFGRSIHDMSLEEWNKIINVDLTSVFLMTKYSIPYLEKSENALIVNIASRIGISEYAEENFSAYGAAKAGVINFTCASSLELKNKNIRVNAILPTPTKTDLFDSVFTKEDEDYLKEKGKLGKPEEVADIVLQIIEDSECTGEIYADNRIYN